MRLEPANPLKFRPTKVRYTRQYVISALHIEQFGSQYFQDMRLENSLKRCRFDRGGMSQELLARAVGVTRQTIIAIEKGRFVPSTLLALKLARCFEKRVEDIFEIVDDGGETTPRP